MQIEIIKTELKKNDPLRVLFLQERNIQFTYNKCHWYGWCDDYFFLLNGEKIGYGSCWGEGPRKYPRDRVFEFYLLPPYYRLANAVFRQFCATIDAKYIECQSNDSLLNEMLFEFAEGIKPEAILFRDHTETNFSNPGVTFHQVPRDIVQNDADSQYKLQIG